MELLRHDPRGQGTSGGPFDQLEAPREVLDGVGAQQAIPRQPQRADEPRITGYSLHVLALDLVVGVVLIAREAAEVGVEPQRLFDLMRGRRGARITGRYASEFRQPQRARVQ